MCGRQSCRGTWAPFYPLTPHRIDPHGLPFQLSAAVVVLAATAAFMFRRKYPAHAAAWVAYVVALLPVLGFVQNGKPIAIVADRYSYLACIGWAIVAGGFLIAMRKPARPLVFTAAAMVVLTLGWLTFQQTRRWKDPETLWSYSASVEPSFQASNSLGAVYANRGDLPDAINSFRQAIALEPDYEVAHTNLGTALMSLENYDEAAREFETALQIRPDLWAAQNNWGRALLQQNRPDEAIQHFRAALAIAPSAGNVRENLDRALELKSHLR